jgi:NodT family efflux transporter outer membrane factor (OMF) lipoprotein
MTVRMYPVGALIALACCLTGCAVGPDFKKPDPPSVTGYSRDPLPVQTASASIPHGAPQRFVSDMDIPAQWWEVFHSETLDQLIEQSLVANPNLAAAQASLRQAWEAVYAQKGFYLPNVSAGLGASRNLTATGAVSPASASGSPYYSLITPQLNVSFVPDVFGANQRAVESLTAQAENQRFQLEATRLTLSSNIVTGVVQEASLRGQIAATEETIRLEKRLLDILRKQQDLGQVAGADVATQEAALAQAEQALPPLHKQLAQQRDALTALSGHFPSEEIEATFHLDDLVLPRDLPLSIPAKLVQQRPDVRAAEATLHSASAQIGQAVAARLPQITLTANVGNSANQLSQMFTPGTNFWTLAGGITAPIFEGGTLLHRQREAEAGFDQASAQYRATVISAFQNVADVLRALQADADALVAASASEAAAGRSLGIAQRQLELGQIAYLTLLNAQTTYQQARIALVQAQANRLSDTAALFQALGGGWWNAPDGEIASREAPSVLPHP